MRCRSGDDPVLLILAADHHIADPQAFRAAVAQGAELVSDDQLLTFGIVPESPRDRLRLHQGRCRDRLRRARSGAVRREAGCRDGAEVPRRGWVLLEQRHVHVQGEHVSRANSKRIDPTSSRCARAPRADMSNDLDFKRPGRGVREVSVRVDRLCGDGKDATLARCCRSTSVGATSVRGKRCGKSRRATPATITFAATSSRSTRPARC